MSDNFITRNRESLHQLVESMKEIEKERGFELDEYIEARGGFGEFKPEPIYSSEGDFLLLCWKNAHSFTRFLNKYVTLYLSFENQEVVGVKISGIKEITSNG